MKIIVAGGRDYSLSPAGFDLLESALALVITELVSGGAPGVDSTAEAWARGIIALALGFLVLTRPVSISAPGLPS